MLQINVPARELPNLLQVKPTTANNPDSGKDRPEIKGHTDEIKQYIIERASQRAPWILGTFTANVAPESITIIELGRGICIVLIPRDVKLDLTDGQHRKQAVYQLIESSLHASLLDGDYFPITVILEDNFHQCQADFRDMAQAKPVDKSLLLSFGKSGRSGITKILIENVPMFRGKTDRINKAPSKKNKLIYTTNYIARFVSCVFTDNTENELESYDVEKSSKALINCLDQFFSECSQSKYISESKIEMLRLEEVNKFKRENLLGVSVGIEILGHLLYCTYDSKSNSFNADLISQLAQLDWSRENSLWQTNVVRVDMRNKNATKKISWGASSISDAVKSAKIELGWI